MNISTKIYEMSAPIANINVVAIMPTGMSTVKPRPIISIPKIVSITTMMWYNAV